MLEDEPTRTRHSRRLQWSVLTIVILIGCGLFTGLRWNHESRTKAFLAECRRATAMEDWQTLEEQASAWMQWDSQNVDATIFLAESKSQQGELRDAVDLLTSLPDQDEKTPAALLIAVDILFQKLNQPKEAVRLAQRLAQIAPEITGVRQRLIFFYALTLQRGAMIAEIRKSISEKAEPPDAYTYLVLANHLTFTNGAQLNATWSLAAPDDLDFQAAHLSQMADILSTTDAPDEQKAQKLEQIENEIESLSSEHPKNEPLLTYRLFRASQSNAADVVGQLLNTVTESGWDNSIFWRYRGWFHHRNGELSDAEAAYLRSKDLFPMDWQTWQGLAEVQRMLGKLNNAERSQEIALEGKELRKHLLQLPNVNDVDPETLHRIGTYAEHCGDLQVSRGISTRLAEMGYSPASSKQAVPRG